MIGRSQIIKRILFAVELRIYISGPKNSTRRLLQLINTFSQAAGYKTNSQKSVALLDTNDKMTEKEIRESIPPTIVLSFHYGNLGLNSGH